MGLMHAHMQYMHTYCVHVYTCAMLNKYILNKFDHEINWFVFLIVLYQYCTKKIHTYKNK